MYFTEYLDFLLSLLLHTFSVLIFIYLLLLPEEQTGKTILFLKLWSIGQNSTFSVLRL